MYAIRSYYEKLIEGMRELTQGLDASLVDGISFGGQMHGLVVLDENDKVLRPAILWNDGRTQEECDYLNNVIGREKISSYTANMALTGFTAPKLLWMKKHEPELFSKIAKIMLPKDYLAYCLSGVHCTDVSDASGMLLFDVKNRCRITSYNVCYTKLLRRDSYGVGNKNRIFSDNGSADCVKLS